jgi:hypothetical protein
VERASRPEPSPQPSPRGEGAGSRANEFAATRAQSRPSPTRKALTPALSPREKEHVCPHPSPHSEEREPEALTPALSPGRGSTLASIDHLAHFNNPFRFPLARRERGLRGEGFEGDLADAAPALVLGSLSLPGFSCLGRSDLRFFLEMPRQLNCIGVVLLDAHVVFDLVARNPRKRLLQ